MGKKNARKRGKNGAKIKNMPPVGKRFSSDYQPENNGRKKKLENVIKDIPEDAQRRIYEVLFAAIRLPNRTEAIKYLQEKEDEMGEYGFVFQIAISSLAGKNGMAALEMILDRIFGHPKIQADLNLGGEIKGIEITFADTRKKDNTDETSKKSK